MSDAPVQLEWYRDTVKWLVLIAAGAVLLGVQWVFEQRLALPARIVFTVAAAALLVASACGILAMFKFADYASSQAGKDAGVSSDDQKAANFWFNWTFYPALAGLALFTVVGLLAIWFPNAAHLSASPRAAGAVSDAAAPDAAAPAPGPPAKAATDNASAPSHGSSRSAPASGSP